MADRSTASEETIGTLTAGTPALNDLIHFYRSNSDFKATMQQFAKFVLEDYAGSTLAGSARSAKSAFDMLDGRTAIQMGPDNCDLNNFTETGKYCFDRLTSNVQNAPNVGTYFSGFLYVTKFNNNKIKQIFAFSGSTAAIYTRERWNSATAWSDWTKLPTRPEIDALNSRLNNNGAWNELLGNKSQNGDYTLNDSYAGYKSVVVMLFSSGNVISSCIYPTTMLLTAGYHPTVEMGSNKVDIVFTSSTKVKVSGLNGSVRIYGIW